MKAAIVTFIRAYNHGAILQTYALHRKLLDLGLDNEVLDYSPEYFWDIYHLSYLGKLRYFPYRPIKNWMKYTPMLFTLQKRLMGFDRFIGKNICLSEKTYHATDEIRCANLPYDAFICGSDQVWSPFHTKLDPVYFLDFPAAEHTKKWSYAASFGVTEIPKELVETYTTRLSGWDKYSVREKDGVAILHELTGAQAVQCCDPTLLLSREEWDTVRTNKVHSKPYILVYYVNSCKDVLKAARRIADDKKLDIISITSTASYADLVGTNTKAMGAKHKGACAPDEFLSLFANASYVVTDSFHGTVFSVLYHKQFLSQVDMGKGKKNNRILDLLNVVGAPDRNLTEDLSRMDVQLDWNKVDEKLAEYRRHSIAYLKTFCEA